MDIQWNDPDLPRLTIGRTAFAGWTALRVTRGIDRMAADFDISVTEGTAGMVIPPFSPCTLSIGKDLVLTGYVDVRDPSYDADMHLVHISGRSKTEDLIDCSPEITGGQFKGYSLDAIARAVCQPFGIGLVVQTEMGDGFDDATIERAETGYAFLERLCRLRGVLACDDAAGNLVLTRAGSQRAAGSLVEGQNIRRARAPINVSKRFSKYIVRTQHGITADVEDVVTDIEGIASDSGCPRYRPHACMGESQMTQAEAQARAMWQAVFATAKGLQVEISVAGWRQSDGSLWQENQIILVVSPALGLNRDLLVVSVSFEVSEHRGKMTHLTLGPVEGYTPNPAQVRLHRNKCGKGGKTKTNWDDVHGIKSGE